MSHPAEAGLSSNTTDKIQTIGAKSAANAESESPFSTTFSTKMDQAMAKK
jgi:hypothetical protein